jgi:hypothetical protein
MSGTSGLAHASMLIEQRFHQLGGVGEFALTARVGVIGNIGAPSWRSDESQVRGGPAAVRGSYLRIAFSKPLHSRRDANPLDPEFHMPYMIGLLLALGVCAFARQIRLDGDRAFYPTLLAATVTYYVLFAAMSGSLHAAAVESAVVLVFLTTAAIGFRKGDWIVAAGFAAHAVFDSLHGRFIVNDGVPIWWPAFCLSFDVGAALVLVFLSLSRRQTTITA